MSNAEFVTLTVEESDDTKTKTSTKRQTWSSQLDFIMTSVGCAVGLGNIWRFPYLCYKNGGGAFFIPYLVVFIFAAAPTYIMEISLGQYMSAGASKAWKIVPLFEGIGFATQIILAYINVYYVIVVAWALYYLAMSFTSKLPWATCGNHWNTARCFVTGMSLKKPCPGNVSMIGIVSHLSSNVTYNNCTSAEMTSPVHAVVEYWENQVLQMSDGIDSPGLPVPGLTIALFVAWLLVYLCICKGIRWTGKIVYFTALFPYVLLLTLFIRGVTLEGALDGLVFYLRPDFSRLGDAQVWIDGGTQVMWSIGVGQGFMLTLGSYNKFKSNTPRNGMIILVINTLTSVFGGLAVFSTLGFMAHETNQPIEKVVASGPGLVFQAYPKAVTHMPLSPLWSTLFFLTILFVGLDSQFAQVEAIVTPIMDRYPRYLYRPRNRMLFIGAYCILSFCISLTTVTKGGVYVFKLLDYYSASGLVLLLMLMFEGIAIAWIFGADRFYDVMELMVGYRSSPWFRISWKYVAPVVLNGIFWFQLITYTPLQFSDTYSYPAWATGMGILLTLSSLVFIPAVAAYKIYIAPGTFRERMRDVTTPRLKKHQICPNWIGGTYRWKQIEYRSHDVNNPFHEDE